MNKAIPIMVVLELTEFADARIKGIIAEEILPLKIHIDRPLALHEVGNN